MSLPPSLAMIEAPHAPSYDFPTWLPAMVVKELRQGLRARGFVGVFILFQIVMMVMFVWAFAFSGDESAETFSGLNNFFWGLVSAFLMLVTPLRGLGALRDEIDAKSIDLLVLTRLKSWQIVLGKWTSLMAQASLLLASVLPYAVVRYFFGAVNLVEDLALIALMYGASGVLTAVALWFSGMPKALRVLMPVLMVVGLQGSFLSMVMWRSGGRSGASSFSFVLSGGPSEVLGIVDSALVLIFFLHQAVRRIAPPAENHAYVTRLLVLTAMVPVPLLHFLRSRGDEKGQAALAFIVLMLVAAVESACPPALMRVHWTYWSKRGGVRAVLGRLFLPGWPSAGFFAAAALVLGFLVTTLSGMFGNVSVAQNGWIAVLAWEAIVAPAILISFLPARSTLRARGATYFGLQAVVAIVVSISSNKAAEFLLGPFATFLDFICHFLPVSSFWLNVTEVGKNAPSPAQYGMQGAVFLAVVGLFVYTSRSYWAQLKTWQTAQGPSVMPVSNLSE